MQRQLLSRSPQNSPQNFEETTKYRNSDTTSSARRARRGPAPTRPGQTPCQLPAGIPRPVGGEIVQACKAEHIGAAVPGPTVADSLPIERDVGDLTRDAKDRNIAKRVGVCEVARRLGSHGGVRCGQL